MKQMMLRQFVLLVVFIVTIGECRKCLEIPSPTDIKFDVRKVDGHYELICTLPDNIWDDTSLFNCNDFRVRVHDHKDQGINVGLHTSEKHCHNCELFQGIIHYTNDSDPHGVIEDIISIQDDDFRIFEYKMLHADEDLLVFSACSKPEEYATGEERFYVFTFREKSSTASIEELRSRLPQSVQNMEEFVNVCDKNVK